MSTKAKHLGEWAGMNIQPHLNKLGLTRMDAARSLGVTERTLRRYIESRAVPGPVIQCLLAWEILKDAGMPWPGAVRRYYVRQDDGSFVLADPQPTNPTERTGTP